MDITGIAKSHQANSTAAWKVSSKKDWNLSDSLREKITEYVREDAVQNVYFESMMSAYWGEVVIKNNEDAKWVVMEYPFSQKKYEFLVNKGLCSVSVVNKFHDLYSKQSNKRRTLLFREYNRYFAG